MAHFGALLEQGVEDDGHGRERNVVERDVDTVEQTLRRKKGV